MAKKPIGLKIDVGSIAELAKQPDITQGGTVHVGELIVSATGITSNGQTFNLSPDDVSLTDAGNLGRGSSGSVRRVRRAKTKQYMALKEIKVTSQTHLQEIRRELETLHQGVAQQSPFLVDFYGAYSHEGSVYIAMECMDGSLADMSVIPPPVLARMSREVLKGLHYLHKTRHLMHRDLKPSNLLYNHTGAVKISDFGVSSQLECTKANAQSFVGTVTYMSPERLKGEAYTFAGDIWSLGITIAELALGCHPYSNLLSEGQGTEARFWVLVQHLNSDAPSVTLPKTMDPLLVNFVECCLEKDPGRRKNCEELLAHPFVASYATGDDNENREHILQWLKEVDRRVLAAAVAEQPGSPAQPPKPVAAKQKINLDDALGRLVDIRK